MTTAKRTRAPRLSKAPADALRLRFLGPIGAFLRDETRWIDLEGALNSGKTTACLVKVWLKVWLTHPGIHAYIGRYSDGDNDAKLRPAWESVLALVGLQSQRDYRWRAKEQCYEFANGPDPARPYDGGSRVYSFGLKSPDERSRYAKIRGLGVSLIYIDQAEELPEDFFSEMVQRLRQSGFPHQFLLSPNPLDDNSWLALKFPESNDLPNRKYYSISMYDNAHNLPKETLEDALSTYPPTHAKHRPAVLGLRGLNVRGTPVYAGSFNRQLHVRPVAYNSALPLELAIDYGKHHPCVVWRQRTSYGGVHYLGGIQGQTMFLEDFLPVVLQYQRIWFSDPCEILTVCDPAGVKGNSQGVKTNGLTVLREFGITPRWRDDANRPSMRISAIESIGAMMRRRTPGGEAVGISDDRSHWLRVHGDGRPSVQWSFLADGFEAGYVWDQHMVSEGSKQYRRPLKDGYYEHGQNCVEYLEQSFGSKPMVPTKVEAPSSYRRVSAWA